MNNCGSVKNGISCPKIEVIIFWNEENDWVKDFKIPEMITQEIKCGKYETIWKVFAYFLARISFNKIVKMIGTGKPIKILNPEILKVFKNFGAKSGSLNNTLKLLNKSRLPLSSVHHGEPQI